MQKQSKKRGIYIHKDQLIADLTNKDFSSWQIATILEILERNLPLILFPSRLEMTLAGKVKITSAEPNPDNRSSSKNFYIEMEGLDDSYVTKAVLPNLGFDRIKEQSCLATKIAVEQPSQLMKELDREFEVLKDLEPVVQAYAWHTKLLSLCLRARGHVV